MKFDLSFSFFSQGPKTRTGLLTAVVAPSPSAPRSFQPQQYAAPPIARPHVWLLPPLNPVNEALVATACGVVANCVEVPMPSCPSAFLPQQYALPPWATPQVKPPPRGGPLGCCKVPPPAAKDSNERPPATATGSARVVVVPSPSSPESLAPQQYAWPEAIRPHACPKPPRTVVKCNVVDMGSRIGGVVRPVVYEYVYLGIQQ